MNKKIIKQIGEEELEVEQDVPAYIQGLRQRIAELETENATLKERIKESEAVLFAKGEDLREAWSEPFFTLAEINERRAKRDAEIAEWKANAQRWERLRPLFLKLGPYSWGLRSKIDARGTDTLEQAVDRIGKNYRSIEHD